MASSPRSELDSYAARHLAQIRETCLKLGFQPTDFDARNPAKQRKKANARDPVLLGSAFTDLVEREGWQSQLSVARLATIWSEIVGEVAAQHCQVEEYSDHKLKIRAASTNWAVQLRLLEPTIKAKIVAIIGPDVVDEIIILGPAPPYVQRGRYSVPNRGWRDTWG